jgi:quinolinate synthase
LDEPEVLMVPDRNLAKYSAEKTNKKVHYWDGYCPIHDRLTPNDIQIARKKNPNAVLIAHPECRPEVLALADVVSSTSGMIRYAKESSSRSFIIATEIGLLYPLHKACPDKTFFPAASHMECPDMKKIGLKDVLLCLDRMEGEVRVPEEIRIPALQSVERMIAIR